MVFFDPSLFHTFSFVATFIASMAGSLHCIGMCGGLVALAGSSSRGPLMGQLGYHMGRGVCYGTLGALAGAFGELFIDAVKHALMPRSPWGGLVALLVLFCFCGGAVLFVRRKGDDLITISDRSIYSRIRDRVAAVPFTLGISTAALPCPWLYSFVLLAAAAGDALTGAKVMTAFWLGTIPALLVAGTLFEAMVRVLLKRYPVVSVASILLAFALSLAAHLSHAHVPHGASPHDHSAHMPH